MNKLIGLLIDIWDEMAKAKKLTITLMVLWIVGTIIVNYAYMNKNVPWLFGEMVLRPWMCYVNVVATGVAAGSTIGYLSKK